MINIINCEFKNFSRISTWTGYKNTTYTITNSNFTENFGGILLIGSNSFNHGSNLFIDKCGFTDFSVESEHAVSFAWFATISLTNVVFQNLRGSNGSVFISNADNLTLQNANFISNSALVGSAGALYISEVTTVNFSSSLFVNNSAEINASAVYIGESSENFTISLSGVTFQPPVNSTLPTFGCLPCFVCPSASCDECADGKKNKNPCADVNTPNGTLASAICLINSQPCYNGGTCSDYREGHIKCNCTSDFQGNCTTRKPAKYVVIILVTVFGLGFLIGIIFIATRVYVRKSGGYTRIQ